MQPGSFLVSEVTMCSPFFRAMDGPYRGKLVEFGETVLAHLPEVGKGSGNPAPKLADRWTSGVRLGKSDLTDEHFVRTDDGVVYARSVRRLAEHSWSEENLKSVTETHRSRGPRQPMIQQILEQYQKHTNTTTRTMKRTTTMVRTKNHPTSQTTEGEMLSEPDTTATSSSDRGEKRTETQENVFVTRRLVTTSPNRPITLAPPPEDPVKRRLMKKTDLKICSMW